MYQGDQHELLAAVIDQHPAVLAVAHEGVRLGYRFANQHLSQSPNMPGAFKLRSRRNLQNDYAVAWCRSLLQPLEEEGMLAWEEEVETSTIRLGPDLAFRIKKTDVSGKASNAETGRNKRILVSGQQSLFPASNNVLEYLPPELRWFTIAFVPNAFDADLIFCGLSMSDGPILPFAQLDDDMLAQIAPAAWSGIVSARQRLA